MAIRAAKNNGRARVSAKPRSMIIAVDGPTASGKGAMDRRRLAGQRAAAPWSRISSHAKRRSTSACASCEYMITPYASAAVAARPDR